jgi:hypothetical protein
MDLILIIIILVLLFGGGFGYRRWGYGGGIGIGGVLLIVLIVYLLFGRGGLWFLGIRRFGAKPRKNFVDDQAARPSSWKTPFIATRMVCSGRRSVLGCAPRGLGGEVEWRQEGFDSFVSEDEQRSRCSEPGWERLVATDVADPADDLFAAEFLEIIRGVAGAVLAWALFTECAHASGDIGGGEAVGWWG